MAATHDAEFFIQIEPEWSGYVQHDGMRSLRGIKAVALTQSRPNRQKGGTALVKLTVRIPDAAFLPLRPDVVIVIPEDMVTAAPIEVIAEDPS